MSRKDLEKDLKFQGLLLLQNELKNATIPTINKLKEAEIDCIMATGDNLDTAISVGRLSKMIDVEQGVFVLKTKENEKEITLYLEDVNLKQNFSEEIDGTRKEKQQQQQQQKTRSKSEAASFSE